MDQRKFQDKLVTILVSKFTNVFTAPDGILINQDDDPTEDSFKEEESGVAFMYFIRTG